MPTRADPRTSTMRLPSTAHSEVGDWPASTRPPTATARASPFQTPCRDTAPTKARTRRPGRRLDHSSPQPHPTRPLAAQCITVAASRMKTPGAHTREMMAPLKRFSVRAKPAPEAAPSRKARAGVGRSRWPAMATPSILDASSVTGTITETKDSAASTNGGVNRSAAAPGSESN